MNLEEHLKKYFGYDSFRGKQKAVIESLLNKQNTFVIMPTGAGKSLCYQLPAVIMEGTAIIISPLIALMKNQVDQLQSYGIPAYYLNSTLNRTEIAKIKAEALNGEVKLLYVAPETLTKEENVVFLRKLNLSFIAVDEVHCISEWGHDFRPEYRKIRVIVENLNKNIPIIALTATATPKVQIDIAKNLQLDDAALFKTSFYRDNLYYEVKPKINPKKSLIQFLSNKKGQNGIIYCLSRKKVEEMSEFLNLNGFKALPYHAGLESNVRIHNQDAFLNEDTDIIVATIAFGMGIDKPNVRFVVHYDAPKSLEGYYQETGRAGRDSKPSSCLMLYSYNDILKLEKFNKDKPEKERQYGKVLLEEVIGYAETGVCRTKHLLNYFGEDQKENCGHCDNCKNPKATFNAKEHLKSIFELILITEEKFTLAHLVSVLCGIKTEEVKNYEHIELPMFGKYKPTQKNFISGVIRQALVRNMLEKDIDHIGVLLLTPTAKEFIPAPKDIEFLEPQEFLEETESNKGQEEEQTRPVDQKLFDLLIALRKTVSKQKNVPPYVVFQEESLEEMCISYPTTTEELSHVNGVGMGKATKFGREFIALIKKHIEENDIVPATDLFIKTSAKKSKNKIRIIQQIDNKMSLEHIAETLGTKYSAVIEEIEHICHSGTKLDIDYYLEEILDDDKIEDIYDYFMEAESDDLDLAFEELGDMYTEDEIRLVHVKFISEVAN